MIIGKNSNCPVWECSCGKYKTIDFVLLEGCVDADVDAVDEVVRRCGPSRFSMTKEEANNSIWE